MVGWHHWLDGPEFGQAAGVGDGQGNLACCSPWGHKESDMTEQPNWTELIECFMQFIEYCVESEKQNVWVRNSYKCIGCLPLWSRGWLGSVACCHYLISWQNIISHTASLGKDKNSKLEVYFLLNVYHFCTNVKSKNCKLNHHKLETLSTKQNNGAAINNQHQYVRHISELPWK